MDENRPALKPLITLAKRTVGYLKNVTPEGLVKIEKRFVRFNGRLSGKPVTVIPFDGDNREIQEIKRSSEDSTSIILRTPWVLRTTRRSILDIWNLLEGELQRQRRNRGEKGAKDLDWDFVEKWGETPNIGVLECRIQFMLVELALRQLLSRFAKHMHAKDVYLDVCDEGTFANFVEATSADMPEDKYRAATVMVDLDEYDLDQYDELRTTTSKRPSFTGEAYLTERLKLGKKSPPIAIESPLSLTPWLARGGGKATATMVWQGQVLWYVIKPSAEAVNDMLGQLVYKCEDVIIQDDRALVGGLEGAVNELCIKPKDPSKSQVVQRVLVRAGEMLVTAAGLVFKQGMAVGMTTKETVDFTPAGHNAAKNRGEVEEYWSYVEKSLETEVSPAKPGVMKQILKNREALKVPPMKEG